MLVYINYFSPDKEKNYKEAKKEEYAKTVEKIIKKYGAVSPTNRDDFLHELEEKLPITIKRDKDEERFTIKKLVAVLNAFTKPEKEITFKRQRVRQSTKYVTKDYYRFLLEIK